MDGAPLRSPLVMVMITAVVIIAMVGAVLVLVLRGTPDTAAESAAPPSARASSETGSEQPETDLEQVLQQDGMTCIEGHTGPGIVFCEDPLTYNGGGSGYGRMRWLTTDRARAFEYLAEGIDDGKRAKHEERLRALTAIGLGAADTEKIIDALPRTKAAGTEVVELGWGKAWLRYVDPPGRYEITGRASGAETVDVPGKSFRADESKITALLRRHDYACRPTRGDGLYCTDHDQHSVDLQRLSGARRFNYVGMNAEADALRDDLLPVLLGQDADRVLELVDRHSSDEYYLGAAAGYRIGVAYGSLTLESVRW